MSTQKPLAPPSKNCKKSMNAFRPLLLPRPAAAFSHLLTTTRLATKKAGGSTKNGRDSPGQRLGVKKFGGEAVGAGNIIIRQRGQKVKAGEQTKMGRDHTIYAVAPGWVLFRYNKIKKFQTVSVSSVNPNILSKRALAEIAAAASAAAAPDASAQKQAQQVQH